MMKEASNYGRNACPSPGGGAATDPQATRLGCQPPRAGRLLLCSALFYAHSGLHATGSRCRGGGSSDLELIGGALNHCRCLGSLALSNLVDDLARLHNVLAVDAVSLHAATGGRWGGDVGFGVCPERQRQMGACCRSRTALCRPCAAMPASSCPGTV